MPTGKQLAEITKRAHKRGERARPNFDERKLREFMEKKKREAAKKQREQSREADA